MQRARAFLLGALTVGLLLGCSSGQTPKTNRTSPPVAPPPTAAAVALTPAPVASPTLAVPGLPAIRLDLVTNQLEQPVQVTHAHDGSGRLFVVEKKGRIVVLRGGQPTPTMFLDIRSLIRIEYLEQGLLSLAFHPSFASNGLFYVHYTPRPARVVVARYQVLTNDPDVADPNSATTLLEIQQPDNRHHGGGVVFGPDGYLYVGIGDGSSCGDCLGNAQNTSVLLGKLLRLDVNNGVPYGIPPDNPFANQPGARAEIWAYGLRNPWRFSFDRANGDLYIADAGQHAWEEINYQPAGVGGRNYGWPGVEGRHCYPPRSTCDPATSVQPVAEFEHSVGCAVVGGHVYRGQRFPQFAGLYFYADYCTGRIWALKQWAPGDWRERELLRTDLRISSFGEDEAGELYLTTVSSDNGLYRLVPGP